MVENDVTLPRWSHPARFLRLVLLFWGLTFRQQPSRHSHAVQHSVLCRMDSLWKTDSLL